MKSSRRKNSDTAQLELPVATPGVVLLCCGPPHSDRRDELETLYQQRWDRSLVVTPTRAHAATWTRRLATISATGGVWGRRTWSFSDFAAALLSAEGAGVRQLGTFERRLLLEDCLGVLPSEHFSMSSDGLPPEGLAAHLLQIITGLKQAYIEPAEFQRQLARAGSIDPMDSLVAAAYEAYQARLTGEGLYDVPGLYWEACVRFEEAAPRLLQGVEQLIFDGFDDFTPSELSLLKVLATHVEQVAIGLNLDLRPARLDLYPMPAQTARRLQETLSAQTRAFSPPAPRSHTEYAAEHLFWRDLPPERGFGSLRENLRVMPCSDLLHEAESVGRRVKALIQETDVAPQDIAIVYRDLAAAASVLQAVLQEFQVPFQLREPLPLSRTLTGSTLLRFFEAMKHWNREQVLDLLHSPLIVPDAKLRQVFPLIARKSLIVAGLSEWRGNLGEFGQRLKRERRKHYPQEGAALPALMKALKRLEKAAGALPEAATQQRYGAALLELLQALELEKHLEAGLPVETLERERRALGQLHALIETLATHCTGQKVLALADFLDRLKEGLEETECPQRSTPGGVQCLEARNVRNLAFEHVFYCGLNEGIVPAPPAANAIYSERDLERLRSAGVLLEGRREHSARERLLFHHVLLSARGRLSLSYRLMNNGRESLPSHLLLEVLELFEGADIAEACPRSDSLLPRPEALASWRDLRNLAVYLDDSSIDAAPGLREARAAAAIEHRRQSDAPWDEYDGVLSDSELIAVLQEKYGEAHAFSVNQLELYRSCPFQFFMEKVLQLEAIEEAEQWFDPLARGTLLHEALCRFHKEFAGIPTCDIPPEAAAERLPEMLQQVFTDGGFSPAASAGNRLELARMHQLLQRYLVQAREKQETWAPAHFEVSFGGQTEGRDPASTAALYELETGVGKVKFSGRIDRVDRSGRSLRIIDYKSGSVPGARDIVSGDKMQLTIYAKAVEELLFPGNVCAEACYLSVGGTKHRQALGLSSKKLGDQEKNTVEAVAGAVAGIRSGQFPPRPTGKSCYGCGASHACRYQQARDLRKGGGEEATAEESTEGMSQ